MAFTVHDEGRQKSTEDAGAPNAKPPPALAAASAPVPAGAPKAERESAPEKEEPLPKANPVLEAALALAPKAGAGAAPNAPAPDTLVAVEDAPPAVAAGPPKEKPPAGAWAKAEPAKEEPATGALAVVEDTSPVVAAGPKENTGGCEAAVSAELAGAAAAVVVAPKEKPHAACAAVCSFCAPPIPRTLLGGLGAERCHDPRRCFVLVLRPRPRPRFLAVCASGSLCTPTVPRTLPARTRSLFAPGRAHIVHRIMQAAAHISEGADRGVERLRLRLQPLLHDSA